MNVNQKGFDRRLHAVQQILQRFGLKSSQVTPLAYVENCPFPFNNFIYKVDLAFPAVPSSFPNPQPATTLPPPEGVSTLVIRISNLHAEGLNNTDRVQNEVAAQYLARQSILALGIAPLVPAIYAWAAPTFPGEPDEAGFGWTMCEFKNGIDLNTQLPLLSLDEKTRVIEQIADVVTALQRVRLPESVTRFGALTFDHSGRIVSGQMPLLKGGPWSSYAEVWTAKLRSQLEEAEKSSCLNGWETEGVRERVNQFLAARGVDKMLANVDTSKRILVHGDLTMNNMLFDPATKRITAILDFDWSAVTHPCDEYLTGLWDLGGGIHDTLEAIQKNILAGDFSHQPEGLSEMELKSWENAQIWNCALADRDGICLNNISGATSIRELRYLENMLCPFELGNEVMLRRLSDEQKLKKREETANKVLEWFEKHGF